MIEPVILGDCQQINMFDFNTPTMDQFNKNRCYVKSINHHTASEMVRIYHYAHRVPSISYAFGLYVDNILAGCITYGMPASSKTRIAVCGEKFKNIVLN